MVSKDCETKPCPSFHYTPSQPNSISQQSAYVFLLAHIAHYNYASSDRILDFGASNHITKDLAILSLHAPYDNNDGVVIDNGVGLRIANI